MAVTDMTERPDRVDPKFLEDTRGMTYGNYTGDPAETEMKDLMANLHQDATEAVILAARHLLSMIAYGRNGDTDFYGQAEMIRTNLGWKNWKKLYNIDNMPPGFRLVLMQPGCFVFGPEMTPEYSERISALRKAAYNALHPEDPVPVSGLEEIHLMTWMRLFEDIDTGGIPWHNGGYKIAVDRDPEGPGQLEDETEDDYLDDDECAYFDQDES